MRSKRNKTEINGNNKCGSRIFSSFSLFYPLTSDFAFPQQPTAPKDSTLLYKKIETFSKQGKFTKLMYSFVFKPVATNQAKKKIYKKLIIKPYSAFEGKVIRHIDIVTLDPFGYSMADTIVAPG